MPGSTIPLRNAIRQSLPDRPFSIELWDGSTIEATREGPAVRLRSPDAIGHVLRAPGELGIGRAYVCGDLEIDDLDATLGLLGRWRAPLSAGQKARLLVAALRATGPHRPPHPPAAELQPARRRHSKQRDAAAVRHHYDVSNEFFRLFLDESMTYSCALFATGAETLEEAQAAKLDLICRKLELRPGQRLLDIGCGWGSLAIHAARHYGVDVLGITLSPAQVELGRERVAEAGLAARVELRVTDYRDLGADSYDAIASIGMAEHVGESQIDAYAGQVARVLRPGGRALNHAIAHISAQPAGAHIGGPFSDRYVFPDSEVLNLSRVQLAFERAGMESLHIENLHLDYAETLRHWAQRLDQGLEEAERLVGAERLRVWRLYLRAARNSFETGQNGVYQLLCSDPLTARPAGPPGQFETDSRAPSADSTRSATAAPVSPTSS
jgi:cyclopropane-fatty-acyl-phospholipid synthase